MTRLRAIRLVALLLVLLGTAGCDQVSKYFARTQLERPGSTSVAGGFIEFAYAENPGAFLSLGASLPARARTLIFTVTVGIGLACLLGYLLGPSRMPLWAFLGLALIWAGGTSNLADRLGRHGLVTDFVVLRMGPLHTGTFNLADLAVVAGTLILLVSVRNGGWKGARSGAGEESGV